MFDFIDENIKAAKSVASLIGISALAATCKTILSVEADRTFLAFLSRWVLGMAAGGIAGCIVIDENISEGWKYAMVLASGLTAKELLLFLINFTDMFSSNPKLALDYIIAFVLRRPIPKKKKKK